MNGGRIEAELAVYNAMETLEIIPPAAGFSANADASDVINIQAYWQEEKKQLPILSTIARKFLGLTATSVASERVFLRLATLSVLVGLR